MTAAPWTPELELDLERARALIAEAMPQLLGPPLEPLGEGWDNLAVKLGDWVVRLPKRQLGAECMASEIAVMPALAAFLSVPVTAPEHVGGPLEGYPWRFAAYRMLEGLTGCDPRLSDAARGRCAEALGRALAQLHAAPLSAPGLREAPPDRLRRTDQVMRAAQIRERAAGWGEAAEIDDLLAALVVARPWPHAPRLVHGDLYARHVLLHPSGELAGLIDWGDVHRGDPALDLSVMWTLLPPRSHARFLGAYKAAGGLLDDDALRRARFRGLYSAVALRMYGEAVGDAALRSVGQRALGWLLDLPPGPAPPTRT